MNRFTSAFILSLLVMTGCAGSNSSETNETANDDTTSVIAVDSLADAIDANMLFENLEDYAAITNKTDLYNQFGKENIVEDTAWYGEGTLMLMASVLSDPNTGFTIRYIWQEEHPNELEMVEAYHQIYDNNFNVIGKQNVPSESGLYAGMPITELQKWNGAPFKFSGFGWDYGGGIFAEKGSKFASCRVGITLDFDYEADYAGMEDLYGDQELNSDDANVKAAPIFINYLSYYPESNLQ